MFLEELSRTVVSTRTEAVAQTSLGDIRGLKKEDIFAFRGVRYAMAERFQPARPVPRWNGLYDATFYRSTCPEMMTTVKFDNYRIPRVFMPMSEDCQFLNIWTKSLSRQAHKPVMVWLHGGALATGSSIETFSQDGENLCRRGDVVVVSVGHRLNCTGFLDLSDFGSEYELSGNAGMTDLLEALRWIRDNIAAFGGDPDNVTLFGQSGGGTKILFLMQTPAADGLYHRVIIESGGMNVPELPEGVSVSEMTADIGRRTVALLGLEQIAEIDDVPYWVLAEAAQRAADD